MKLGVSTASGVVQVLFLCTANQARSVVAEHAFNAVADGNVRASSAGVAGWAAGQPALPDTAAAARRLGLELGRHRSRSLSASAAASADVVVGFERQHLAVAAVDFGVERDRLFLLPELVHCLRRVQQSSGERDGARERLRLAGRARPTEEPGEIRDPAGTTRRQQAATAQLVTELAGEAARLLSAG